MSLSRAATYGCLFCLLAVGLMLPLLDDVSGWEAASYAAWPSAGAAAALVVLAGPRRRTMLVVLAVVVVVVLTLTHGLPWWASLLGSAVVVLPAWFTAAWMHPSGAPFRRYREDEVDAYHAVTAVSGLITAGTGTILLVAVGQYSVGELASVALLLFFSATTAQLLLLPFVLRDPREWLRLGNSVELWGQRLMLTVFCGLILLPETVLPMSFVLFPILGWAAIRAQSAETHLQVAVVSGGAFVVTLLGRGPFAVGNMAHPGPLAPLLVFLFVASICYLLVPLALTVSRLSSVTRQATSSATTVNRMLDSATGTVFIATDPQGLITHANRGAERALGLRSSDLVGRHPLGLGFHTPEEVLRHARHLGVDVEGVDVGREDLLRELFVQTVAAQVISGRRRDWEFVRADGEVRTVSLNLSVMTEPSGRMVGLIASGEDITERARAQWALELALEREHASTRALREADAVKQELVSTVSHELRTPITSIAGYAELLVDGQLGELQPRQHDAVDRIERNSARLNRLVDDLLTLATAESGTLRAVLAPTDLNDVVRGAHEVLARQLATRDVAVRVELHPQPVMVLADESMLERAVINLWNNAVKFTPDGGEVTVATSRRPHDGADEVGPGLARVTVTDTGVGIPEDELDDVFTRFHRTAAAGERAVQGSGLGLSIVRTIAEQHDAEITLESTLDVGTTISLELAEIASLRVVEPRPEVGLGTAEVGGRRAEPSGIA